MCYLNNTIGNIRKIFNVVVQFSPEFVDDQKTEHHHAVKLHHGVNLYCKSEGNPEPSIKWIFVSFFYSFDFISQKFIFNKILERI